MLNPAIIEDARLINDHRIDVQCRRRNQVRRAGKVDEEIEGESVGRNQDLADTPTSTHRGLAFLQRVDHPH